MQLYPLIRPLAFALDAERAHRATIAALKLAPGRQPPRFPPSLHTRVAGVDFPSPVGLAAGFDKNADVPEQMLGLGFGFVEVGTVTPRPQPGNPRPRLFRLVEDRAVINRMGFNNDGQPSAFDRLQRCSHVHGVIGVNIGANKDSADRIADYAVVLMTAAARRPAAERLSATELAGETGVPLPTAQKLMGLLATSGLLKSVRGAGGGFTLARHAGDITLADIVEAVEGPIAMTVCSEGRTDCALDAHCHVKPHMGIVGNAVRGALDAVSLQQLSTPAQAGVQPGQEGVWAPASAGARSS